MGLRLVNIVPTSSDLLKPGQPVQLGLRSETGTVEIGSLRTVIGLTSFQNREYPPEHDILHTTRGAIAELATTERRLPVNTEVDKIISSGSLLMTKTTNSDNDKGIYEFKVPINTGAPILGYFKFRKKTAWALFDPDWCDQTNMTGMYFGLEHGTYNTAGYTFLRKDTADGSLIIGGPLPALTSPRPAQAELTFEWGSLADNTVVELWLYFNVEGYSATSAALIGVPALTSLFEVWGKRAGLDTEPVVLTRIPIGTLGEFPGVSTSSYNYRSGPSDYATLFFGNAGRTGDILQLDDWSIFPDFRLAVSDGEKTSNHQLVHVSDSPGIYRAEDGSPLEIDLARWSPLDVTGAEDPQETMYFQPGRLSQPLYVIIPKSTAVITGVERIEPRLEQLSDGMMVEAFIAGRPTSLGATTAFGGGFGVEDGDKLYQLAMVQTAAYRTLGLSKTLTMDIDPTVMFHLPTSGSDIVPVDWSSLKLVRLTVDRVRSKIMMHVNEEKLLDLPLASTVPTARSANGRIIFGHLLESDVSGDVNVASVRYLQRYKAWEPEDGLPTAAPIAMSLVTSGSGASTSTSTDLVIDKQSFGTVGSKRYYSLTDDFTDTQGFQIDFRAKVNSYKGATGAQFESKQWTGSGVKVVLGNKTLTFGFFECGTNGKRVGIIPGSGSVDDIVNLTALGRRFSTEANWEDLITYRISYRPFDKIEIWTNSFVSEPSIVIPWVDDTTGFDIPLEVSGSTSIAFGHFDEDMASKTSWEFFRWGQGNGYDVAITQEYPGGVKPYHFNGKSFILSEFDE